MVLNVSKVASNSSDGVPGIGHEPSAGLRQKADVDPVPPDTGMGLQAQALMVDTGYSGNVGLRHANVHSALFAATRTTPIDPKL